MRVDSDTRSTRFRKGVQGLQSTNEEKPRAEYTTGDPPLISPLEALSAPYLWGKVIYPEATSKVNNNNFPLLA